MLSTLTAFKAYIEQILKRSGLQNVPVGLMRVPDDVQPRVVLAVGDSPLSRTSVDRIDEDTIELHCVDSTPEGALRLMDLLVDELDELRPGRMQIEGGSLTGCELLGGRNLLDNTDAEDTYDAATVWRLTVERPRTKQT